MENSVGNIGVVNPACDIDIKISNASESKTSLNGEISNLEKTVANGSVEKEPTKHARFKIINHSNSTENLETYPDLEGDKKHKDSLSYQRDVKDSLPAPLSSLMKRRQSEHSTHHDGLTIGYSSTEAIPMTAFYRNEHSLSNVGKQRPTLHELHKPSGVRNRFSATYRFCF